MRIIDPITVDDIRAARVRIAPVVMRTPLIRLNVDAPSEIYLKLAENLESFLARLRDTFASTGTAAII